MAADRLAADWQQCCQHEQPKMTVVVPDDLGGEVEVSQNGGPRTESRQSALIGNDVAAMIGKHAALKSKYDDLKSKNAHASERTNELVQARQKQQANVAGQDLSSGSMPITYPRENPWYAFLIIHPQSKRTKQW